MIDLTDLRKEIKIPPRGKLSIIFDSELQPHGVEIGLVLRRLDGLKIADVVYAMLVIAHQVMHNNGITDEEDMVPVIQEQWQRIIGGNDE